MLDRRDPAHVQAARVAGLYVLVAVLWIATSDRIADRFVSADALSAVQTTKDIAFVLATGVLLYFLTRNALRRTRKAEGGEWAAGDLLGAVVESSPLAIVVTELDGTVRMWNPGAEATFGWAGQEVLGLQLPQMTDTDEERQLLVAPTRQVRAIVRRRRKDGTWIVVEAATAPLFEEDGRPRAVLAICRDITSERALEAQVRNVEKYDAIGRVAGGVAHDVNNLMTVILGHSELIRLDRPEAGHDLAQIDAAAQRATEMASKLLAFSGRQPSRNAPHDLNTGVTAAVDLLRGALGVGHEIDVELEKGLPLAPFDGEAIERIVVNLILNARDATAERGRIRVSTRTQDDAVLLEVEDDGTGMDARTAERAFEPYFTTKGPKAGTGLGLATVYGLVTQAGGSIELDSVLDRGTRVSIRLPLASRVDADRRTVLIVEDEEQLRHLVSTILARDGFTCHQASNADEAEQLFREHDDISLVLTDVVMPRMNGYDLAERLRALRPDVTVMYMSGHAEVEQPDGAEFLEKPFLPHVLLQAVRTALASPGSNHG